MRNSLPLTTSDARSSGPNDLTYATTYTYSQWGDRISTTVPATADFPGGRTARSGFTTGTETSENGGTTPKGLLAWTRDATGQEFAYKYNKNGDLARVVAPNGLTTTYTYDNLGRRTAATQKSDTYPAGVTTSTTYDKASRVLTTQAPATTDAVTGTTHTPLTTNTYDSDGNTLTITVSDTTGGDIARVTTRTYNGHNQVASIKDPMLRLTKYTYDAFGHPATKTDPTNAVYAYAYTDAGQLATTTLTNYTGDPVSPQTASALVLESRAYDPAGRLATVTDSMGRTKHNYYNDDNTLAEIDLDAFHNTDGSMRTVVLEQTYYDAAGQAVRKVTGGGKTTTTALLDAAGRTTSTTVDPGGLDRITNYTYDAADRLTSVARTSDSIAEQTDFTYDSMGKVTSQSVRTGPYGPPGPIGWWKLNETSGVTATDSAGRQAATLSSGVNWSSEHGGSVALNGTGGIATPSAVVNTTKSFSVSAWAKLTDTTSYNTIVAQDGPNSYSGFYLQYSKSLNAWAFIWPGDNTNNPQTWPAATSTTPPQVGVWTHLVGVFDASNNHLRLYVNGVLQADVANPSPWSATGRLTIGKAKNDTDLFHGGISDVEIFDRPLTAADVTSLMTSPGLAQAGTRLTTTYAYDKRGLRTAITDPRGNVAGAPAADFTTQFVYDQAGQQTQAIAPTIAVESGGGAPQNVHPMTLTGYNTFGEATAVDNPVGNITSFTYNADGERTAVSEPAYTAPGTNTPITPTTSTGYDKLGRPTSVTDPRTKVTKLTYDQLGNLTRTQLPVLGTTTPTWRYTYDTAGERLSATDPTGARTEQTYDDLGRPVTATQIVRQPTAQAYTMSFGYDDAGNVLTTRTAGGSLSTWTYNAAGQPTTATDPIGRTVKTAYDGIGRVSRVTAPDSTATTTTYDLAGNRTETSELDPAGTVLATTKFGYDPVGQLTSATDPGGATSTYTYNALGNKTGQVEPVTAGSSITTSFGYDALGRNTRYTDGNGNPTYYGYNTLGLPESTTVPAVTGFTSVGDRATVTSYDANSRPVKVVRPGGVTITSGYDDLGRLTTQAGTGAEAATTNRTFGYDLTGRLTSASAPGGTNTYTYDDRAKLLTATGPGGNAALTYTPDADLATRTDKAGTATFTWDPAGQLSTAYEPETGTTLTYGYDGVGQVTSVKYGTGSQRALTYDNRHQLASDTLTAPGGAVQAQSTYTRDLDGRITVRSTNGLAGAGTQTYTYDQAGRITSANDGTTNTPYGYDNAGNRTSAGNVTATYNERNQLTSAGTSTYTYNARGAQTQRTTGNVQRTSTYDAFDQLTTAGTSTYTYDALGRMATAPGRTFSYAGTSTAIVSDGPETYSRGPSGNLTAVATGTNSALALTNPHGDLLATFAADGSGLTGSTAYDPYGQVLTTTGSFTSADTIAQNPTPSVNGNPYTYANDDPLANADPTGHNSVDVDCRGPWRPRPGPQPQPQPAHTVSGQHTRSSWAWSPFPDLPAGVVPDSGGAFSGWGYQSGRGWGVEINGDGKSFKGFLTYAFGDSPAEIALNLTIVGRARKATTAIKAAKTLWGLAASRVSCDIPRPPGPTDAANKANNNRPSGSGNGPQQTGSGTDASQQGRIDAQEQANPQNGQIDPFQPHTIGECSNVQGQDAYQECGVDPGLSGALPDGVRHAPCAGTSGAGLVCDVDFGPFANLEYDDKKELDMSEAEEVGVAPAIPGTPRFDEYIAAGEVKWGVRLDGVLVAVPVDWGGVEIFHSVLTGRVSKSQDYLWAAGTAEIAKGSGGYEAAITNYSGHYQPDEKSLDYAQRIFEEYGIRVIDKSGFDF
ncbi:hypothetical protein GCM10023205_74200 [Yinghuangia aomiensis]|uniref:LamG-like jellyroll fold domain-containing protein n=1 Tax=Yinghuangia aomiensis TaxID=676205 RepID=A0ABP9I9A7_9ACTN